MLIVILVFVTLNFFVGVFSLLGIFNIDTTIDSYPEHLSNVEGETANLKRTVLEMRDMLINWRASRNKSNKRRNAR